MEENDCTSDHKRSSDLPMEFDDFYIEGRGKGRLIVSKTNYFIEI